jgi:hypothetical protein
MQSDCENKNIRFVGLEVCPIAQQVYELYSEFAVSWKCIFLLKPGNF